MGKAFPLGLLVREIIQHFLCALFGTSRAQRINVSLRRAQLRRFVCTLPVLLFFESQAIGQTAANWTKRSPETSLTLRQRQAMAYDAARSQVVLFGGVNPNSGVLLNDTWVWDGSNWTQKSPQTSPPAREGHAMAYDIARGRVVLFGGLDAKMNTLNDTWLWDGINWAQSTAPGPGARGNTAMAYDADRSQVVLFGGEDAQSKTMADTWVWDGSNWTQKSPAASPAVRLGHAMVWDAARSQVVLFGGDDANSDALADTWVWDGGNWTQKSPQTSPPPRVAHAMAYDGAHSQTVIYGGMFSSVNYVPENDTWVWDGGNWNKSLSQANPPAGAGGAMAYDSTRGQIVMTLWTSPGTVTDTWTRNGGASIPSQPIITSVMSASGFGGLSAVAPGTWIEIYGSNLAPETRQWTSGDFDGDTAPSSLDGVVVTVGGQRAFIDYISSSPGQINAQLPSSIATGATVAVTVTNGAATSSPFNVTVNNTEPGLLAPASFQIGGKQYVAALLSDGATYVIPTGAMKSLTTRPAHPGETITMYGIGFGSVAPNISAGQILAQFNQLACRCRSCSGRRPRRSFTRGSRWDSSGFISST